MPQQPVPTEFRGKKWIYVASTMIIGGLACFCLAMGPLFLTGAMKRADGKPATDAGMALSIFGVPLGLVAALALFKVVALRRPILRVCREGIVVNRIAASTLEGLPHLPGFEKAVALLHVVWLIVSLQGFKQRLLHAPWETFQAAQVGGLKMQRKLAIFALFFRLGGDREQPELVGDQLVFDESVFVAPLDGIAQSLLIYSADAAARQRLPSWDD